MSGSRGVRLAVPVVTIGLLVWLLVGCVYIPTWERVQLRGTHRDFRDLTGPGEKRTIVVGHITRAQIEGLLGPPPYASADGRAVAYTLTTRKGLRVVPLCLTVGSGCESQAAVRLEYGPDGVLKRCQTDKEYHELRQPVTFISDGVNISEEYEDEPALSRVDHGDLRPTAAAPPPPFPQHAYRSRAATRPADGGPS